MPFVRRRPLLRAAALGGTYAYGKHRARLEDERQDEAYYAGQQSAMAAPPPAPAAPALAAPAASSGGVSSEDVARLQELGRLRDQGVLTDEEFARQKALILG